MKLRLMQPGERPHAPLAICDDTGTPLPMQQRVEIEHAQGGLTRATVVFLVDGDKVRLG